MGGHVVVLQALVGVDEPFGVVHVPYIGVGRLHATAGVEFLRDLLAARRRAVCGVGLAAQTLQVVVDRRCAWCRRAGACVGAINAHSLAVREAFAVVDEHQRAFVAHHELAGGTHRRLPRRAPAQQCRGAQPLVLPGVCHMVLITFAPVVRPVGTAGAQRFAQRLLRRTRNAIGRPSSVRFAHMAMMPSTTMRMSQHCQPRSSVSPTMASRNPRHCSTIAGSPVTIAKCSVSGHAVPPNRRSASGVSSASV